MKKAIRRTLAVLVATTPIDTIVAYSIIKGIGLEDMGLIIMGMLILLVGGLYTWFGASEKNKLPLGMVVIGLVISIMSMMALGIGLVLVATPISFITTKKLWDVK